MIYLANDNFDFTFHSNGSFEGHVITWNYHKVPNHHWSMKQQLEDWYPLLRGTVLWHKITADPVQDCGEMFFGLTLTHTPILILNSEGQPWYEWLKGELKVIKCFTSIPKLADSTAPL